MGGGKHKEGELVNEFGSQSVGWAGNHRLPAPELPRDDPEGTPGRGGKGATLRRKAGIQERVEGSLFPRGKGVPLQRGVRSAPRAPLEDAPLRSRPG